MDRLRIALVAPVDKVRPPLAGGSVQLVCRLAEHLADRGHEVTVLGTGRPDPPPATPYRWLDTQRSTGLHADPFMAESMHSISVDRMLDSAELDIVHDHTLSGPLLVHRHEATVVHTVYTTAPDTIAATAARGATPRLRLVAVSDHQRALVPNRAWLATVHPAVAVETYPFGADRGGPCVILDELGTIQDTQSALEAAHRAGRPAVVVGSGSVAGTWESVDPRIGRLLGPGDRLAMHPSPAERIELLTSASCLLAPLTGMWPFCSAMTEALACGTPVVALRRGAATEIVDHGVTGWLCDHPGELASAVAQVGRLDRRACRQQALDRFDLPRMADELETAYHAVVRTAQRHIIASGPAVGA
ncbi:MAG TPA: glycosyltransferase [Actinomycetota bacterium]|jgi:glycosyltransferase involved in cell wall biosynthesis|nr:glycosyltransferase [Actinomycetota bacterium]